MIIALHRFHGHNSLRFVYANSKTFRSSLFAIKVADNPRRKSYRCAVVVSKKVSKSAVVRNRIRRRLYEQVRTHNITGPVDMVVTVFNADVATMPAPELQTAFQALLGQSGVIE